LAPPTLGGSGALGVVFITTRLGGASVLAASSPPYASFMEESGSISWGDLHKVRDQDHSRLRTKVAKDLPGRPAHCEAAPSWNSTSCRGWSRLTMRSQLIEFDAGRFPACSFLHFSRRILGGSSLAFPDAPHCGSATRATRCGSS
jgi:hypothetical protein